MPLSLRLLLVEDDRELATTLGETFELVAPEMSVVTAGTLAEAMGALRGQSFDAILVDLGLPDSQGLDTFRALRAHVPESAIVVVTGQGDDDIAGRAATEGAQDYLVKGSFSGETLVRAVRGAVGRQRLLLDLHRSQVDLEARVRQQAAVAELGAAAAAARELAPLVGGVVHLVATTLEVDFCSLLELLPGGLELLVRAGFGLPDEVVGAVRVDASPGSQSGYTLQAGSPVVTADLGTEARFRVHRLVHELGIKSAVSVVVPGDPQPWGVLNAQSRTARVFTPDDVHFLEAVANVLGSAVSRQRAEAAQRAAERARGEAESRLRQVIARSPAVLYALTPASPHAVTWMSENAGRILGFAPDDFRMLPDLWSQRVHPEDAGKVPERQKELVSGEDVVATEYRFRHVDGRWLWLSDTRSLVRADDGTPLEIVGACQDVTTERQLEEQLRQAQKMEAVGRLAGGVAHDFNNLLTAIGGYSELLLMRLAEGDPARHDVEEIRRAGERAAALTRQLLTFSRRQVLQQRVLNLNDVVGDTERMLERLIGEDVRLVTALAPGALWVKADPGQLEQVVVNLAVNARDAMPRGGRLTITSGHLDVKGHDARHPDARPGRWAFLQVADTGTGMEPQVVRRIFEPFFTTKDVGKGTGLGLATIYGIVQQTGGWIEVESEPGRGSVFTTFLPEAAEPVAETPRVAATPRPGGVEVVLVVEDEPAVRTLVCRTLRAHAYEVLEAPSGAEALAIAARHAGEIHLLLTDVVMPDLRGPELRERLVALRPQLRTVFMSGYSQDSGVPAAGTPGVGFLQKPFTPDGLTRALREMLDRPAPPP